MAKGLILAPFSADHLERLRRSMEVTYESWLDTRRLYDPDELAARLETERTSILVVESDFLFEEVFEQAHDLKFVGVCRNSTDNIDVGAATLHGVAVVNTPSRNAQAVAEHALGLMLALARRIPAADQYVKGGHWQNPVEPYFSMRGVELRGRTLGVIGIGAIGERLAEIGLGLGMEVLAHDPHVDRIIPGVALTELDDLLAGADFVSVHVPLTAETEGLFDGRRLSIMKSTAYLINASNASVVDQNALAEALGHGRIAGAAFDVFETHPVSPQSPLLGLENIVLTPHLGGATEETIERHSSMMADDILRFLRGQRPDHLVNSEVWERRG